MIEISKALSTDWDAIWPIFNAIVDAGETYVFPPDMEREEAFAIWMSPMVSTYVAMEGDRVVGSYILKPNHPGRGSHVANASFMVDPQYLRHGVGHAMGEHCIAQAKSDGYQAIVFNFVVSTNEPALSLWKSLDFSIVGTLPKAFNHPEKGLVDAYVMHRYL